jgi:hypothetical protein
MRLVLGREKSRKSQRQNNRLEMKDARHMWKTTAKTTREGLDRKDAV